MSADLIVNLLGVRVDLQNLGEVKVGNLQMSKVLRAMS